MRVLLMHADRNLEWRGDPPAQAEDLVADLGLDVLLRVMAGEDTLGQAVCRSALLCSLEDEEAIRYRQAALADVQEHPDVVRGLLELTTETLNEPRKLWTWFGRRPEANLRHGVEIMALLVPRLRMLREIALENRDRFRSPAFRRLFQTLVEELGDAYIAQVEGHLARLRFARGVLVSARLGPGTSGIGHVLRRPLTERRGWLGRVLDRGDARLRFEIAPRDDAGHTALAELRARGVNSVANAVAQSSEHVLGFFTQLRAELSFYVGCLNLRAELERHGHLTCLPTPHPSGERTLSATLLYDAVLALRLGEGIVANDVAASGRSTVLVTGANRGGKSTLLRSIGIAQLMLQAGMFVPARAFSSSIASGIFSHFMREEDPTMTRGKLDEELSRMSRIIDRIRPGGTLLCNESFASTNESEGAEIGEQVVRALTGSGVRVLLVTHIHELARRFVGDAPEDVLFLRAERRPDGTRTFRVREGGALPTSFAADVYRQVFAVP